MWQGVMGGTRAWCTVFQVGTLCKVKLKAVMNTVQLCVKNKNRNRCALEKTRILILIWIMVSKMSAWWTTDIVHSFVFYMKNTVLVLKALIDGPCSGVLRRDANFKSLHLTQFTIKIGPSARTGTVRKKWEADEITKKWQETTWAKKIAAKERVRNLFQFQPIGLTHSALLILPSLIKLPSRRTCTCSETF